MLEQPTFTYRMVISSNENHALAGILTKAMYAMPKNLVEDLAAQYTTYKATELTFVDWIRLHPVVTVWVLLILGWLLTAMAVTMVRLSARKKAQKTAQEKAEEMAELAEHAQAANKAKTAFLSHMSHDMRTPMNAIIGFTGIAMKNNPSDEVKNCLEKGGDGYINMRYRISDTGIGMSEEFTKEVFEEFAQEDSDVRTQYHGAGLGMAIVKKYVDMMGGTISVQSKKHEGTTFTVDIPLEITDKECNKSDTGFSEKVNLTGVNVLLAEDNELNAEIAAVQLEEFGMNVERVADGKNIPIIAVTANAFAEDVQASLDAGMNAHLSKPIVIDEVIKTILRYVYN